MKNLGPLRKTLAVALVAVISAEVSSAAASEEVRLPTATEIQVIKSDYEKTFGVNLKHVHIFYDDPRLSHRGPVGAIRTEKLNACVVVVNSRDFQVRAALSFMKGAPNQEVARKFLVAHELTHCLFSREDSMRNLKNMGLDVKNEAHSQEVIADLVGAVFVAQQGQDSEQVLDWLRSKRSGFFFHSRYNTAKFLNAEVLQKIDEQMKITGTSFTFFSESKLFNVKREAARSEVNESFGSADVIPDTSSAQALPKTKPKSLSM